MISEPFSVMEYVPKRALFSGEYTLEYQNNQRIMTIYYSTEKIKFQYILTVFGVVCRWNGILFCFVDES